MSIMKEKTGKRKYRRYDVEFKKNAVKMIESGRRISEVSKSLGVNEQSLYEWRKKYGANSPSTPTYEQEVKELRKKLRQTELERDILKKALSIFSRQI